MALTLRIDPGLRLVHLDLGAKVPSMADLRRALDEIASHPLFRPGVSVLIEGGHLYIERALERDGLVLLASRLALNTDIARWAFLTANLATYRERRSIEIYAQGLGIEYRVFVRRREAMNWLLSLAGACSA
jgi:hypothetical protein